MKCMEVRWLRFRQESKDVFKVKQKGLESETNHNMGQLGNCTTTATPGDRGIALNQDDVP